EDIKLSVKVTNKGTLSGRDVVQVYARVIYEENISTPLRKLYRFYKTPTLMPGESIIVNFTIPTPELGYYTESGKVVKEGRVEIMVGMLEMTREIPPPPSKKPPVEEPVMPKDTISLGVLLIIVTLLMIAALLFLYGLKGKGSET
ncbi:MAG: fibronectin type III-like domain-contianing protein, partial [Thermoproteota archaeon]